MSVADILLQPSCSYIQQSQNPNFIQNNEPKKKKKPRWRNMKPKKKRPTPEHLEENEVNSNKTEVSALYDSACLLPHFSIKPVTNNPNSVSIGSRNRAKRKIRINSYIKQTIPVVFTSKTFVNNRVNNKADLNHLDAGFRKFSIKTEPSTSQNTQKVSSRKQQIQKRREKAKPNKKKEPEKDNDAKQLKGHLSDELVEEGLKTGKFIKGSIRINPKNYKEAYVSNEDRTSEDYIFPKIEDRNGALEADEVVFELKPKADWKDGKATASVVAITKKVHSRIAIGYLKFKENRKRFVILTPRDTRIPQIRIPQKLWQEDYYKKPKEYQNVLFLVEIEEWTNVSYATGKILQKVGKCGGLDIETSAILLEYQLNTEPFSQDINDYYKAFRPIEKEEMEYREDLRDECIFTIDPETAKDLDDAVSCKELPNGNLKVGVHISDVAFFLEEGSELDKTVSQRATTIYLVNNTYHMLPVELCLQCSLLPGQEKRAFSVFWELTKDGEILHTYFTRSVIKSCAKLAYEHAQQIIENPDAISYDEFPEVHGNFTQKDLRDVVKKLQNIAVNLRKKRFENGALRLDQPKLSFVLDAKTGKPLSWAVYEIKDANRLIEEFMLLANMTVATKIREDFPNIAFLRHHESPVHKMLVQTQKSLESAGIFIDVSSSKGIQSTLWKYCSDDFLGQTRTSVLNHLFAKAMKRANYICAANNKNESYYWHYALHIPIYTHFTSPIRRYADIMVHRLLAASLGYCDNPKWNVDEVKRIAENCNTKKYNAKKAGDASMELFLAYYVEEHQPFIQNAVVAEVREKSFEIIVLATGSVIRMFPTDFDSEVKWRVLKVELNPIPIKSDEKIEDETEEELAKKLFKIEAVFPSNKSFKDPATITIERFAIITVSLTRKVKSNKLDAKLVRPIPTLSFERNNSVVIESSTEGDLDSD